MTHYIKNTIITILIVVLGAVIWKLDNVSKTLSVVQILNGKLSNNLESQIKIYKTKVKYTYRENNSVKEITANVPVEGNVSVATTTNNKPLNQNIVDKFTTQVIPTTSTGTYIVIKRAGFTFKPAISVPYDFNNIIIGLESRFLFYDDFGSGLGITTKYGYFFIDYRLTAIKLSNITLGLFINSKSNFGIKAAISLN